MSTAWYAAHASVVWAVEDDDRWFERVVAMLKRRDLRNVRFSHGTNEAYWTFGLEYSGQFDLVIVDGSHRSRCVATAIEKVRPDGVIYLDNSDKDSGETGGDIRAAEARLIEFARSKGAEVRYFVDFAPGLFFVQEGMMVVLPG